MIVTATLADCLIAAAELDPADVRLRARYLREAELLPDTPRGRRAHQPAPQIDDVHAAVLLLGCLDRGTQLHVHAAVRRLWNMPAAEEGLLFPPIAETFGEAVRILIDQAAAGDSLATLQSVLVFAHGGARIEFAGRADAFGKPETGRTRISVASEAPRELLLVLGELVARSRDLARAGGITIDSSGMRHALQTSNDVTWGTPRQRKVSEPAPERAGPENETAASLPGEAAVLNGQPATTDRAHSHPEHIGERENSQSHSESLASRSHRTVRGDRSHEHHPRSHSAVRVAA